MENKNQNDLFLIEKQNQQIQKLKSIIMELYNIIKYTYENNDLKLINLTFGSIIFLLKDILDF
jgi:hypothetical protein